jgi:hypothetical protein
MRSMRSMNRHEERDEDEEADSSADAVDEINRLLKIIFLDLQTNDQIMDSIINPTKKRWTNSNSYSGQLFEKYFKKF